MLYDKADKVIQELFESLLSRYQIEEPIKGGYIIFDCVNLLHYKCHKINPKRSGSYIDSPDWIKTKKQQ